MLLQQLRLSNIRSYKEECLDFPQGSIILSGDIGSGKSSLLLAIEFALFGTSRPELTAESLLRKGAVSGFVELAFRISGKEIIIKRNLKKDKDSIKQTSGYIIIDRIKKELMPTELKAEVIKLLGYPEDFISKEKNYLFRYTVYTPQEEMKLILLEDAENRLNVLRKIFNLDKYKNVRENLQVYLKEMRSRLMESKMKIEPLDEHQARKKKIDEEISDFSRSREENFPLLEKVKQQKRNTEEALERWEEQQKTITEIRHRLSTDKAIRENKKQQLSSLVVQEEKIKTEISFFSLPEEIDKNLAVSEAQSLEKEKNRLQEEKTSLQEKIRSLQIKISEESTEISFLKNELSLLPQKEERSNILEKEIRPKESFKERKVILEDEHLNVSKQIARFHALLEHSHNLKEKIFSLDNCPTCLQEVHSEHKEKISIQERNKIEEAQKNIHLLNGKRQTIMDERKNVSILLDELNTKEYELAKIKIELDHLKRKKTQLAEKENSLRYLIQGNNLLQSRILESNYDQKISESLSLLSEKQELIQKINSYEIFLRQKKEVSSQIKSIQEEIGLLEKKISEKDDLLLSLEDSTEKIAAAKSQLNLERQQENRLSILMAQLETRIEEMEKQRLSCAESIQKLLEEKSRLAKMQEVYLWLEEFFLNLTYTIEKQVLANIHRVFNEIFQEWFSILIDDENIYARIDDSLTPVIEQNGYEIAFQNLSGGEKTSAALAYRLALNKVINQIINEIKTKDLLILDEPTDGFSTEQLDKVREVLDRLNLAQIIIVSHENKIESFVQKVIRVRKEGHISTITV